MARKGPTTTKAHCNECGHETRHRIIASRTGNIKDLLIFPDGHTEDIVWTITSEMIECCGCGTVSLRRTDLCSGFDEETVYFPPRVSRRLPYWFGDTVVLQFHFLIREIYAALHADSRQLAMMGARALLDLVILDKVGNEGTFAEKLDALVHEGYVSSKNREVLEAALEAGHAAVHRGHMPTAAEVNQVMDIIENLLQAVYVLKGAAEKLKKTTPKRR